MFRGNSALYVPDAVRYSIATVTHTALVASFKCKVTWVEVQLKAAPEQAPKSDWALTANPYGTVRARPELAVKIANILLDIQTPEGDFPFDPDGRHNTGHNANAAYWRPLGQAGDSAVDLCATASLALMEAYKQTANEVYKTAIKKA